MERSDRAEGFRTGRGYGSLMYGSSRSSIPESELLHRQAYGPSHSLQGFAGIPHSANSNQSATWATPGRTLGLFDTSLHHASPSAPEPSVMDLITTFKSRGPQPSPSASSFLSRFQTPLWQTAMNTPSPADLFIAGALPGSGSFASTSFSGGYHHPGSFSGRSFTPSLALQNIPSYCPTSCGLMSPHNSLLPIKTASQSSLRLDRIPSSQSDTYQRSQEFVASRQTEAPSISSRCQLPSSQANLLFCQNHSQPSQPYNASMFSSTPAVPPASAGNPYPPSEGVLSRQDSVIKHYQSSSRAQSSALHQFPSCGGSTSYQQIANHCHQSRVSCSPSRNRSPSSEVKPTQTFKPRIQSPYTPSSSSSMSVPCSASREEITLSSSGCYPHVGSGSSTTHSPHIPPSASSYSTFISKSDTNTNSLCDPSRQQPPPQSAAVAPSLPVVSSTLVQQHQAAKHYQLPYGPQSVAQPTAARPADSSPRPHVQPYSPHQLPSSNMSQLYGDFSSDHCQDLNCGAGDTAMKACPTESQGRLFSADIAFDESIFGSAHRTVDSPVLEQGARSLGSALMLGTTVLTNGVGSADSRDDCEGVDHGITSYNLPESTASPSVPSSRTGSGMCSLSSAHVPQSPGGSASSKFQSSILSPAFVSSPQDCSDTAQVKNQPYHVTPPKTDKEIDMLRLEQSHHGNPDNNEDFLIHHLLHDEDSTSHSTQHDSHLQPLRQLVSDTRTGEGKEGTFNSLKISEDSCHSDSVLHPSNTCSSAPEPLTGDTQSGLNHHTEKKQNRSELIICKSPIADGKGITDSSLPDSHSLSPVVQYERGDPYTQHTHSQHSNHIPFVSSNPQQYHQHSHHSKHTHAHYPMHSFTNSDTLNHMKKASNPHDSAYLEQSQASRSLMNSSPDLQHNHMLQSYSNHTKMDIQKLPPHQQQQQQQQQPYGLGQRALLSERAGPNKVESLLHGHLSPSPFQIQSQDRDILYSPSGQPRDQIRASQSSMSSLDMMDQSLSKANHRDSGGNVDLTGIGVNGRHRFQQQHHLLQQTPSDLHDFLGETELGLSRPSHLHHLTPPSSYAHAHGLYQQQVHSHLQLTQEQSHPDSNKLDTNIGTPQKEQHTQNRELERQHPHSQLNQLKQSRHDAVSPVDVQQQQFVPLTSTCFPDSVVHDEERSFFPEMDDMFCSSDYRTSCVGDFSSGQSVHKHLNQGRVLGQEGLEAIKTGAPLEVLDTVGHPSDQGYRQYCHNLLEASNGNVHVQFNPLKTPSTLTTHQTGFSHPSTIHTVGLSSASQQVGSVQKIQEGVKLAENSRNAHLLSPNFCSSRPKKLLKTGSFHLLKQRQQPQAQTKKNYAHEYDFEDDEDKIDIPAEIRLNSRRVPNLLPDLVSSCRKFSGPSGVNSLSPLISEMDFCQNPINSAMGEPPQFFQQNSPRKRGRKPTKTKREGPPRPRGRPRIRPLPEPSYGRGLMGSVGGERRRARGRGRGRGRRAEGLVEMQKNIDKAQSLGYCNQQQHQQGQFSLQQNLQQYPQHLSEQTDMLEAPRQQHLLYQHLQQLQEPPYSDQRVQQPTQRQPQEPDTPTMVELSAPTMPSPQSLSNSQSFLCDTSGGSAPSVGLSPGPGTSMDNTMTEPTQTENTMMNQQPSDGEMIMVDGWTRENDASLDSESWIAMQKKPFSAAEEKTLDFMPSFLDFLKTGKAQSGFEAEDPSGEQEASLQGGLRPLSPPLTPSKQPSGSFSDGEQSADAELALSSCHSPCKPLDEELKENLETLPSFSSDEEDSVSKNQDLQKSISCAISALYDTPHALAAVIASAVVRAPTSPAPAAQEEASLSTPTPENNEQESLPCTQEEEEPTPVLSAQSKEENAKEEAKQEEEVTSVELQDSENVSQKSVEDSIEAGEEERIPKTKDVEAPEMRDPSSGPAAVPSLPFPSISDSPPTSSSPSPPSSLCISPSSPLPISQDKIEGGPALALQQEFSYLQVAPDGTPPPNSNSPLAIQPSPLSNLPVGQSIPPPSTTPPPSSSDHDQDADPGQLSPSSFSSSPSSSSSQPPSPLTPEEDRASKRLTSLHVAKKQADAAIAGESDEDKGESGGEGIFRERDEFVVRTEDIGMLKMALQTGREPPPIWRVQKALLQKFSPEIKDGQRQFCATSNYLGYFGDAKTRYQRLYVKFLENVNKKDYVRVCTRKPWHRAGLTLRRQSLPKHMPIIYNQSQPRIERDDRDKERQKEREKEQRQEERKEKKEHKEEKTQRQQDVECERKASEQKERERTEKEKTFREKIENERERINRTWRERDKWLKELDIREKLEPGEEKTKEERRAAEQEEEQREERPIRERKKEERPIRKREKEERPIRDTEKKEEQPIREREKKEEPPNRETEKKEEGEQQEQKLQDVAGNKQTSNNDVDAPPTKRRKLKESPSSSSTSPSDDEGQTHDQAMREMFRSYVEMLVSAALDPDMIQALEDTDDELYLPPMRKIHTLLNEQKKKLLRSVSMSAQHQEALRVFPKMTVDPLECGSVKVHLGGEDYNRKTLNRIKRNGPKQQDLKLSIETCRIYSLFHSLHHYKYHTFLHCKKETDSVERASDDPGQEEVVQQCMANHSWLESLFKSFVDLLSLSASA
ncbi:proline-rich protein 12-like isoform X2 [Gouania willdenowi]|uniref:Proline-rich protein 12-like n=1 Tax=Gouania willdenowi TaxID=441366 RepID=A0A8C5DAA1_GOUWI|nr:proline-rich protein 12-like isoform X2 [Gouania willdenowi]